MVLRGKDLADGAQAERQDTEQVEPESRVSYAHGGVNSTREGNALLFQRLLRLMYFEIMSLSILLRLTRPRSQALCFG